MKSTILILSILFSVHCFGQKWHLNNVDENQEYPYEYWFQFENIEDTCSYELSKKSECYNSTIRLLDNQDDNIVLASIKIINIEDSSETILNSDFNGNTELHIEDGKHKVEVRVMNYDSFDLEFEIENAQQIELDIKLGLAPELTVYQIDSKKELKETEILQLIECVRINRNEYSTICSELRKYRIMMHI